MHLVRFATPNDRTARIGVLDADGTLRPVFIPGVHVASVGALMRLSPDVIRHRIEEAGAAEIVDDEVILLPPADGRMEVWAAGVTYHRSRDARMEESATADVYELVYEAERPELFLKCVAWRAVTDGEPVSIRRDSTLDVPEPELSVLVNAGGVIIGYGICNDVSSRSIEGDNPLYVPQAKVYAGSCALGSGFGRRGRSPHQETSASACRSSGTAP